MTNDVKEYTFMYKVKVYPKDDGDFAVFCEKPFQVGKNKFVAKPKKVVKKREEVELGEAQYL